MVSPAVAAQSDWLRSEGGDVRIVATPPAADGTIPAILEIRLKPGWKTYWLNPGAGGIAPQVSFEASPAVAFSGLRFPAPQTFDDGLVRFNGYDHPVGFPLLLKANDPAATVPMTASVFLGICKEICIPVQGDLSLTLKTGMATNPLEKARIDDAVAALPQDPSDAFKVVSASFDPALKTIRVAVQVPAEQAGGGSDFFLAGPPGYAFGKPENVVMKDGTLSADIPVREPARGGALKSGSVVMTVIAGTLAMQTPLAFD